MPRATCCDDLMCRSADIHGECDALAGRCPRVHGRVLSHHARDTEPAALLRVPAYQLLGKPPLKNGLRSTAPGRLLTVLKGMYIPVPYVVPRKEALLPGLDALPWCVIGAKLGGAVDRD